MISTLEKNRKKKQMMKMNYFRSKSESIQNETYFFVHSIYLAVFRSGFVLSYMQPHTVVYQFPYPTVRLQSYPFLNDRQKKEGNRVKDEPTKKIFCSFGWLV